MSQRPFQGKIPASEAKCFTLNVAGYYYAFLMFGSMHTRAGKRSLVSNLVGFLNYRSKDKPSLKVFENRDWMKLYFGKWNGKQLMTWCDSDPEFEKEHLELIGAINLKPDDPEHCGSGGRWQGIVERLTIVSTLPEITSREEPC